MNTQQLTAFMDEYTKLAAKKGYSQGLFKNDTAQTTVLKALKKAKD